MHKAGDRSVVGDDQVPVCHVVKEVATSSVSYGMVWPQVFVNDSRSWGEQSEWTWSERH